MTDAREPTRLSTARADLVEDSADWVMFGITVVLVAGWLSWVTVAAYRLVMGM
jgi:hypothetical protein